MEITHYIMPRGSGKTVTCRKEMLSDGCLMLSSLFALLHPDSLRGKIYNKVIIDDYIYNLMSLSKDSRQKVYNNIFDILASRCKKLELYSTPVKKYSREALMLSELLMHIGDFNNFKTDLFDDMDILQEAGEINQCLLNPYQVHIVKNKGFNELNNAEILKKKNCMSEERFDIDFNANFIKENKKVDIKIIDKAKHITSNFKYI